MKMMQFLGLLLLGFFPSNIESAVSAHLRMMQSIQHADEADLCSRSFFQK